MIAVQLTSALTNEHRALVLRYLGGAERFSSAEWVTVLEAFTRLGDSTAQLQQGTLTFQALYDRIVDQGYSDRFVAALLAERTYPPRDHRFRLVTRDKSTSSCGTSRSRLAARQKQNVS